MFSLFAHIEERQTEHQVLGWEPRNDTIVVLPLMEADRTQGGIIIAEDRRERPQKGIVLAVGPGLYDAERTRLLPVEAEVGDLVIFGKYSGSTFEIADNVHVLMMRNVEFLARQAWGVFGPDLVEHLADEATTRERLVYHLPGMTCEYCGRDPRDAAYRRALATETPDERAVRWERVHVEKGEEAARLAEDARKRADEQRQLQEAAAVAAAAEDEPAGDLIAEERARLARQSFEAEATPS